MPNNHVRDDSINSPFAYFRKGHVFPERCITCRAEGLEGEFCPTCGCMKTDMGIARMWVE